jgi:exopolyphosphatase/guanosine-5'-triphosphate,3'-diphosphate pyrophosphatase
MEIKKYAAIDIGSNAIRLLIANIIVEDNQAKPRFKKNALVRVPIRLGKDVFISGKISDANIVRFVDAAKAFSLLMKVHGVEKYRACATSAMRESSNGEAVAKLVEEETGIAIQLIDGKTEAKIIAETDLSELLENKKTYLYVDVGGGSTEFTLFNNGKVINSKSFKIGTVRLINDKVDKALWQEIKSWIKENTAAYKNIELIGSGGNINKLFKMSGRAPGKPLSFVYLKSQYNFLKSMTYEERIIELSLNTDRADVIIPATKIYLKAMDWSNAKKIYVPKIGLADGIIKALYFGRI